MEKYVCDVCGWEYDPAVGDPENGIEPGIAFEDLPEDWVCPLCGVGKDQFSPAQETGFQINPNRSLEKASCHFLMTAIRKTALYMLDS